MFDFRQIKNPHQYRCKVYSFSELHRTLVIVHRLQAESVEKADRRTPNAFYLVFTPVIYYEGPTMWNGANYSIGDQVECNELLRKCPLDKLPDDSLSTACELIKIESDTFTLRIVTSKFIEYTLLPPETHG